MSCSCLTLVCKRLHSAAAQSERCLHCRVTRALPQRRSTAETVRAFEELSRASAAVSSVRGSQVSLGAAKPQGSVTSSHLNARLVDQPRSASATTSCHSDFVRGQPAATTVSSAAQQGECSYMPEGVHQVLLQDPLAWCTMRREGHPAGGVLFLLMLPADTTCRRFEPGQFCRGKHSILALTRSHPWMPLLSH